MRFFRRAARARFRFARSFLDRLLRFGSQSHGSGIGKLVGVMAAIAASSAAAFILISYHAMRDSQGKLANSREHAVGNNFHVLGVDRFVNHDHSHRIGDRENHFSVEPLFDVDHCFSPFTYILSYYRQQSSVFLLEIRMRSGPLDCLYSLVPGPCLPQRSLATHAKIQCNTGPENRSPGP